MTSSNRLNKDDQRTRNILLLVDFQEGFLTEETEYLRGPMQALVLSPFFSLVIATRFQNVEGSLWRKVLHWSGLRTTQEQQLAVRLPPRAVVIDKGTYGLPPEKLGELIPLFRDSQVFVAGIETDVCVTIIAAALFDVGIPPIILAEYTGSNRGKSHQAHALVTLSRIVGKEHVVANLTGVASTGPRIATERAQKLL
jgi:hypothetical protein